MHWDDSGKRACMAWPTTVVGTSDDFALDLASMVLTGGRMSRLHRRIVLQEGLATSVSTQNDARVETGAFWIYAECAQGVAPEKLERAIDREIERLRRELVPAAELKRAKRMVAAGEAYESETVSDLAEEIGEFATDARWQLALETVARVEAVTAKELRDCARRLFARERRVLGWSTPRTPRANRVNRAHHRPGGQR